MCKKIQSLTLTEYLKSCFHQVNKNHNILRDEDEWFKIIFNLITTPLRSSLEIEKKASDDWWQIVYIRKQIWMGGVLTCIFNLKDTLGSRTHKPKPVVITLCAASKVSNQPIITCSSDIPIFTSDTSTFVSSRYTYICID